MGAVETYSGRIQLRLQLQTSLSPVNLTEILLTRPTGVNTGGIDLSMSVLLEHIKDGLDTLNVVNTGTYGTIMKRNILRVGM